MKHSNIPLTRVVKMGWRQGWSIVGMSRVMTPGRRRKGEHGSTVVTSSP